MECHGKCQVSKELQDTSPSFSLSNLGFDFHFIHVQHVSGLAQQVILYASDSQASKQTVLFWKKILLNVPTPPPNFNFS